MASADVIVLGTGGMGTAACAALASRGASVLGLDRFPVAHDRGSSHGQTRLIRQAYFEHPDYVPLLLEAYRRWERLEDDCASRLLTRTGLMLAGPAQGEAIVGALHAAAIHRLPVEKLSAAEGMSRFPGFRLDDDWVVVFEAAAGHLLVEECVRASATLAIRHGARLEAGVTVLGWREEGGGVAVDTDRGTHRAARLVVTPGAWAAGLVQLQAIPLQVLRKSLFWHRPTSVPATLPCFAFDLPSGFYYGFPAIDERGVKIAEHTGGAVVEDPLAFDRAFDAIEASRVGAVAAARLPFLEREPAHHAACLYTMTPDSHFLLGLHPEHPRVAVAAGFSGHGFKFASVVGPILADLALDGRTDHPIGFLSPTRFGLGR